MDTHDENDGDQIDPEEQSPPVDDGKRQVSFSLTTALTSIAVLAVVAVAAVFGVLYFSARAELSERDAQSADTVRARQVAMEYAIGASTIDYRDPKAWQDKLKANVSPELAAQFDATAPQLEQIILPLQWTSTATPIQAAVTSESDGIYRVNAFIDVDATSVQNREGGRTTVTYTVTLEKNADWRITEVGGGLDTLPN